MPKISLSFLLSFSIFAAPVFADNEAEDETEQANAPEVDASADSELQAEAEASAQESSDTPEPDLSYGTKLYDAATVGDLFKTYDQANKRRAAELEPHLNSDHLEVIELDPVHVEANRIRNFRELANKIDPQPRRRLERLAELDPEAAADLRVTMRAEERFFAGEDEAFGDMNASRTANVDFRKVGASVAEAVARAKKAMRSKKVTDDQQEIVTGEE